MEKMTTGKKTKTLNVMHVASFWGNIGDNANHTGMRKILSRYTGYHFRFKEVEIRDFYIMRKKRKFDDSFVREANRHDLLLIGGGNFFDLWINESATGTTIDIKKEIFEQIKVPVIFFGLGCDPYKGAPEENLAKFRRFLDTLLEAQKCLVTVRNDGSITNLEKYIGKKYAKKVLKVPDGGFFTEVCHCDHPELNPVKKNIAVNLAGDMLPIRFQTARGPSFIGYNEFSKEIAQTINNILDIQNDVHVIFVPHIYADLKTIGETLELLADEHRRERVTVAPYLQGYMAQNYVFDLYKKVNLVIGMRFHANVCSIALNTPTIGLGTCHYKIRDLYAELAIPNRFVDVSQRNFKEKLIPLIISSLREKEAIRENYDVILKNLEKDMKVFCGFFSKLLG